MKRLLTFALGLAALASCNGVKWTLTETEYGYNVMTQKNGQTIAYSPESGISILTVDGYAFKDLNRNGELDVYEDWRLPAEVRAQDLAEHICDCAKRRNINTRHDDITVMAAIIEKTV